MKSSLLFAKFTLIVIAVYAYMSFAFVDALKGLTYPKSETLALLKPQPLAKEYITAQVNLKQAAGSERTGLSY